MNVSGTTTIVNTLGYAEDRFFGNQGFRHGAGP